MNLLAGLSFSIAVMIGWLLVETIITVTSKFDHKNSMYLSKYKAKLILPVLSVMLIFFISLSFVVYADALHKTMKYEIGNYSLK